MKTKRSCLCFAISVALLLPFATILNAATAPDDISFYKGKVVTYIVPTKPGGGYDTYARLIGKYLQKYLPGSTVIIRNIAGAGDIIGANTTYLAKPNGLTIGTFNTGSIYSQIIGQEGIQFDMSKISWIGKANSETRVFLVGLNTPYKTFKDIMDSKVPIKIPSSGAGSQTYIEQVILGYALPANIKPIPGYSGKEGEMAILRGEVDAIIGSYTGLLGIIMAKECRVLLHYGSQHGIKGLESVPHISSINVAPRGKNLINLLNSTCIAGRLTGAPPGMPAGRLQVLRDAYKKALTDPELIKEAKKMQLDLDPAYGDTVQKLITESVNQPAEIVKILKELIKIE